MRTALALLLLVVVIIPPLPPVVVAQTTEADVYVAQAVIDFDEKRYDAAIDNLKRALALEADHIEALYYMGVVHMARRQPQEAIPFLLRARQKSPADVSVAFQLGLAYFGQQLYDQAEPYLEEVFRQQPTLDGLGYYVGFMRYRKKNYRGAMDAFRAARATDPEIQQLTLFYTGLALAILGLPSQASAEVEQAVRLAPGSPLTGPAERLRDTIVAARAKERRFSAELRLGGFFDDNVAVVPNKSDSEPLVPELRHAKHESSGELVGFRADYSWLKHVVKRDDWDSTIGYTFFGTYNNEMPRFNVLNHMANLGATHKTSIGQMPAQFGGQYAWDVLYLNDRLFTQRHTATLFAALVESDLHLTQLFGRFQNKVFKVASETPHDEIRDGNNYMIGALHMLRFSGDAHFVKLGYQFDWDAVEGKNYRYRGNRLLGGGQYTLPWKGVRLKYDIDAHLRDYLRNNSQLPSTEPGSRKRSDKEITSTARAEVPFLNTCVTKDDCVAWVLAAEYQRTMDNSNIAVFDYTRNVFSLILSLTY